MSQHGVFQEADTFTCQVDAEQQSSQLFSHGAVNAAVTGRPPARPVDHTGEFIHLQVRTLPRCDSVVVLVFSVVFHSEHLLRQTHGAVRNAARISEATRNSASDQS